MEWRDHLMNITFNQQDCVVVQDLNARRLPLLYFIWYMHCALLLLLRD